MKKVLLLGAGFSYDLGMPLVTELTDVFLGIFEEKSALNFAKRFSQNNPFGNDRPINEYAITEGINLILKYKREGGSNYEKLISELDSLRGRNQSDRDSYNYLSAYLYGIIYDILRYYQIESYSNFYPQNYSFYSKIINLFSDEGETWIFTLNHDLYAECLAIDLKIPISYGDDKTNLKKFSTKNGERIDFTTQDRNRLITKENFISNKVGINLVKLHGGLNEFGYEDTSILLNQSLEKNTSSELIEEFRIIQNLQDRNKVAGVGKDIIVLSDNQKIDILTRSMLTGGNKYSKTNKKKAGEEKLQIFDDVLRDVDELTIIGYGFNDFHINFRISNAMLLNEGLKIKIVDPFYEDKSLKEMFHQFRYDQRVSGARCTTPDWLNYVKERKWYSPAIHQERNSNNSIFRAKIHQKAKNLFKIPQESRSSQCKKTFRNKILSILFFMYKTMYKMNRQKHKSSNIKS